MPRTLDELAADLTPEETARVAAGTARLIAENGLLKAVAADLEARGIGRARGTLDAWMLALNEALAAQGASLVVAVRVPGRPVLMLDSFADLLPPSDA